MAALTGQYAVVTGAGSGIGRAIAHGLGAQGATVALVGRNRNHLGKTASGFGGRAPRPLVMPVDVCEDDQLASLGAELGSLFGRVDVLVMSAGDVAHGPVESTPIESLDHLYRLNLRANYRLVQLLLPLLRKRPGQMVFINSSVGLAATAETASYSATKHGLRALADSVRAEVNADRIRVLSVYPGRVATPMQQRLYAARGIDYRPELLLQPGDVASVVLNALMLPETAEVTDISLRPLAKSY